MFKRKTYKVIDNKLFTTVGYSDDGINWSNTGAYTSTLEEATEEIARLESYLADERAKSSRLENRGLWDFLKGYCKMRR